MLGSFSFQHVIWDWNGTLLDDTALTFTLIQEILAEDGYGIPTFEEYRSIVQFPVRRYYEKLAPGADYETITELMQRWSSRYESRRKACTLHTAVPAILDLLKKRTRVQSILSAHTQKELEETICEMGVRSYFHHVVGVAPNKGGESKVDTGKRLVGLIEREHKITRACQVIIGDSSHDAEVADALGIRCVLVANGLFPKRRLEKLGYPILDTLDELVEIVMRSPAAR